MIALPAFIERGMAHFATVEKHLAAQEELTALKTTSATLTTANELLTAQVETLKAAKTQLDADLATAKTSIAGFDVKIKNLEATINDPAGEIETRSKMKALEIAAGQGIPPIPPEKKPDAPGKLDVSGLFGREKFIAIEKAERAARNHRN